MNSLRWRLTVWFGASLLAVVTVLILFAHWHLDYELRQEKWERTNPGRPDWILHGSFTDTEVHDILSELMQSWLIVGGPLVGLALLFAYFLARQSTRPVRAVNQQLARLGPATLASRIRVPDADPEIHELVRHLNDLLGRLDTSFAQLQEYTSQVAHELRTPLHLMRLRVETHAACMDPELAEGLQEELARLSNYVEAALTIARAEQGRLETHPEPVPLRTFLADVLEPFSRLAAAEGRQLLWTCPSEAVAQTDRAALKQILFNLLNNALKHGGGDLVLRVRKRSRWVSILVGNRTAEPSPTPREGLGIGLRLVHALAHQMGHPPVRLRRGARYWVRLRLPLAPAVASTAAPTGSPPTARAATVELAKKPEP